MIGLLETLLTSDIGFRRCLIISPLNAVLNWVNEWEKWVEPERRPPVSRNLFGYVLEEQTIRLPGISSISQILLLCSGV